jgi:hypothetical protein
MGTVCLGLIKQLIAVITADGEPPVTCQPVLSRPLGLCSLQEVHIMETQCLCSTLSESEFLKMIYLTAIGLTPGGSGTVHIYTQYTEYRGGTYVTLKFKHTEQSKN